MFFKSNEHKERFLTVAKEFGKVYNGEIDPHWGAALYILTADAEIWEKCERYTDPDELRLADALQELDFLGAHRKLIRLASNLFNEGKNVTPYELANDLDQENFKVAMTAIILLHEPIRVEDISLAGRPSKDTQQILELWNSGMSKEAIARHLNIGVSTVRRHLRGMERSQNGQSSES